MSFTVTGLGSIDATVSTDHPTYGVGDSVQVRGTIHNASQNVDAESLTAVVQVLDQGGGELFRSESNVAMLLAGARNDVPASWIASGPGSGSLSNCCSNSRTVAHRSASATWLRSLP